MKNEFGGGFGDGADGFGGGADGFQDGGGGIQNGGGIQSGGGFQNGGGIQSGGGIQNGGGFQNGSGIQSGGGFQNGSGFQNDGGFQSANGFQNADFAPTPRAKGDNAESRACEFLEKKGFTIIERNFFAKVGEIDIIAVKNNVIHFVEVKSSATGFEPIYQITPSKLKKLTRAIAFYMSHHNIRAPHCLDALLIKGESVELLENITMC